jgi:hypothetical protein
MFEQQQIDEFAKEFSEHFGPLLTQPQLATLLDRSLGELRYIPFVEQKNPICWPSKRARAGQSAL